MNRPAGFKSRTEGYNQRTLVWTCTHCHAQFTKKPKTCDQCQNQTFHYFQSRTEANRYASLLMQEQIKAIDSLEVHPEFPIFAFHRAGKPVLIFKYIADFRFNREGNSIIEDVKPSKDERSFDGVFKLKRRAVEKAYGVEISIYVGD